MSLRRSPPGGRPEEIVASTRHSHITPRNSDGNDAVRSAAAEETPYDILHRLANITKPTTPLRRASSAGPTSQRSTRRTPIVHIRTPGAVQRPMGGGSAKRQNVLTPHGRAAMREVEARRAGFTPGKDRRRSGRQQRETPRDDLRKLSKLLAPTTQQVVQTPQGQDLPAGRFALAEMDDFDDGPDPVRPRLSLPIGEEDDEDESLLLPPRSSGLEDVNYTAHSIELPRRAISERPNRVSRGSFGSIRMSDQFPEVNRLGPGGAFDSSFAMGGPFDDNDAMDMGDDIQDVDIGSDYSVDLRDTNLGTRRISTISGRDSDIRIGTLPADDTENTFVFTIPQRDPHGSDDDALDSLVEAQNDIKDWEEVEHFDADELDSHRARGLEPGVFESMLQGEDSSVLLPPKVVKKKKFKISKYGIQYPSLPAGVVKKLATQYARTSGSSRPKIRKETLDAIMQATDWFFEQASDDLGAYSKHARRKTIDESDIVTLMKRQRQTNAATTPFSLAQRFLPRELLQELRMVPPSKLKRGRQLEQVDGMVEG